jgi:hypothetical protein
MTAAELAKLLHGVRRNGSGYSARCPSHDDQRASLSFRDVATAASLSSAMPVPVAPSWRFALRSGCASSTSSLKNGADAPRVADRACGLRATISAGPPSRIPERRAARVDSECVRPSIIQQQP